MSNKAEEMLQRIEQDLSAIRKTICPKPVPKARKLEDIVADGMARIDEAIKELCEACEPPQISTMVLRDPSTWDPVAIESMLSAQRRALSSKAGRFQGGYQLTSGLLRSQANLWGLSPFEAFYRARGI